MGGMGAVYRAVQAVTERAVAVKVLHRHLSSEVLVKRFQQEARIISKLNHPHVVTVYKYGQHTDGALFIAMELAEGRTLTDLIQQRALFDAKRYVPLMMQIVDAVAYAHDLRIIHRDLKPENVIVGQAGRKERVKVLDFGIAKMVDNKYVITKTGMLCGSPPYMAPEQWSQSRDLDGRVDIYSLGVVFYAMVTGRLPYEADSTPEYMTLHLEGNPVPPAQRSESLAQAPALNDIILRCMEPERADRYGDAYELLEALKAVYLELQTSNGTLEELTARQGEGDAQGVAFPALPITEGDVVPPTANTSLAAETLAYGGEDADPSAEAEAAPCRPVRSKADFTATGGSWANGEDASVGSLEWTRQTLMSESERAREHKLHIMFLAAGAFMLLFLAVTFVYLVWINPAQKTQAETTSPPPAEAVMSEPPDVASMAARAPARKRTRSRTHRRIQRRRRR